MWLKDNYFYHGYITGVFAKDCCPRYMSAEFYPELKKRVNNVTLFHGLLGDAAKKRNDWTVISLLDSMDWMPFEMVAGLVHDIVPCVNKKKCRIFWRSFAPDMDVHSPVLAQLFPDLVPDYDRVGWYLSQWECKVPKNFDISMIKAEASETTYNNSTWDDIRVMGSMAMHALRKSKDVATFYKSQGPRYDGFREALLPDRDTMMQYGTFFFFPFFVGKCHTHTHIYILKVYHGPNQSTAGSAWDAVQHVILNLFWTRSKRERK